jgi:hypothetical protein
MVMLRRTLLLVLLGTATAATPVAAQSDYRFAAGVGVTFFESTGKGIDDAVRLTPVLRSRRRGFGAALGFNWLATEVEPDAKNLAVRGDLRVRPIMIGPAYTAVTGRLAATAAIVAGYAFNRIAPVATGSAPAALTVANSVAWAPSLTLALDLSRRFGVVTQASYLVTRPRITTEIGGIVDRSRWRADTLVIQTGVVIGVFR